MKHDRYIIRLGNGTECAVTRTETLTFMRSVRKYGGHIERRPSLYGQTTGFHGQRRASYLLATTDRGSAAIFRAI